MADISRLLRMVDGIIQGVDLSSNELLLNQVGLKDVGGSFYTYLDAAETLTANRTLGLVLGDANRTLTLSANVTLDQDVDTTASPTFAGLTVGSGTGVLVVSSGAVAVGDMDDIADGVTYVKTENNLTDALKTSYDSAVTHITSDGTDHTYINQDVRTTASPSFVNVTISSMGTADTDAATKGYVDTLFSANLQWQNPVLDRQVDATLDPGASPTTGDRYIIENSASLHANFGTITGVGDDDIVEYNGSAFEVAWDASAQGEGGTCWVEDEDKYYTFNGTAWVSMGNAITHNNLSGIQGGTTAEYYHMTSAEHTAATRDATNALNGLMPSGKLTSWDGAATHVSSTGADHSYINQDVTTTGTPTFASLTIGSLSGVLKATAGAVAGSATMDDIADGVTYVRSENNLTDALKTSYDSAVIHISSTGVDHTYINQDVTTSGTPSFAGITLTGDVTSSAAIDWDLVDNNASALSFDATGKLGILAIVTTDGSEGVTMSGTLTMGAGTSINEFSIDGTLAGNSDDALPTEKAVKTYVDNAVSGAAPDGLDKSVTIGETMGTAAETHIFPVRYALTGETAGRFYLANKDAAGNANAIGFVTITGQQIAGASATMVFGGSVDLGADDTAFNAADVGKPVYVSGSGTFSVTAPTTSTEVVYKLGIVATTTSIEVDRQFIGVN